MNNSSVGSDYLTVDNATHKTVEIRLGKFCIKASPKAIETFMIGQSPYYLEIVSPSNFPVSIPSIPARVYLQHERWDYFLDTTLLPIQLTILETRNKKPLNLRNASHQPLSLVKRGKNLEDEIFVKVSAQSSVSCDDFLDLATSGQARFHITNPCHDRNCRFIYPTTYHFETLVFNCIDDKDETQIIVRNRITDSLALE
ncbi:Hypothetical protein POVR1_LOCUS119 [uncultured virus]|nr:Hypothetical protein POVR1_LOCUS119 [uncultured virus]